jgi:nicotinamidase-related amidase
MNTSLLIIDIQNDYFPGGTNCLVDSEAAVVNVRKILDKFRSDHKPVIHIQHIATKPSATFFLPNTLGAEIHEMVKPLDNEKVFIKHYPNSFRETGLFEYLKDKQVTNLVVCGMMTHMCIDATVRAAKDLGFTITLVGDACATKNLEINGKLVEAEAVHHSFLAALGYFYADIINTNSI